MKKLLSTVLLYLIYTALIGVNCFGQRPKTDAELLIYAQNTLKPKINDSLIVKYFNNSDVVVEGLIVDIQLFPEMRKRTYKMLPCRYFKGIENDTIKVTTYLEPPNKNYPGEWSHEAEEAGIFFLKKNGESYNFISPINGWVSYPDHISVFCHEKLLSSILYNKILEQKGAFCHKTTYFNKKKDFIAGNAKNINSLEIFGLSKDTIPAGILSGASTVQVIGEGFGIAKGQIHLPNSNNGGATHFRLHPDQQYYLLE